MSTPQSPFARVGSFPVAIPGLACHRFHDAVLVGTAQMYGHGLLSKRDAVLAHGLRSLWLLLELAEAEKYRCTRPFAS